MPRNPVSQRPSLAVRLTVFSFGVAACLIARGLLNALGAASAPSATPLWWDLTSGVMIIVVGLLILIRFFHQFNGARPLLIGAFAVLFIDSAARWVDAGYVLGMAIEHALQIVAPLLLFYLLKAGDFTRRWMILASVAASCTFVGHGLYASGFHTVPGSYREMTTTLLNVNEGVALRFLFIAGVLDFAVAIGIWFGRTRAISLLYMVLWGGATALARVTTAAATGTSLPDLGFPLAETLVRSPHWIFPLVLFWQVSASAARDRGEVEKAPRDLLGS